MTVIFNGSDFYDSDGISFCCNCNVRFNPKIHGPYKVQRGSVNSMVRAISSWCPDCLKDMKVFCYKCGVYDCTMAGIIVDEPNGEFFRTKICGSCSLEEFIVNNYTKCNVCNCIILHPNENNCRVVNRYREEYNDSCEVKVCLRCSQSLRKCAICEVFFDYSEDELCGICQSKIDNSLYEYSYKPNRFSFFKDEESVTRKKTIYYGIELEVNLAAQFSEGSTSLDRTRDLYFAVKYVEDNFPKGRVYLKKDGSLSSGFEIVTHPHSLESHYTLWNQFLSNPPNMITSYKSGECGLHVHVSRDSFTKNHLEKLIAFVNDEENYNFIRCLARRDANRYCKVDYRKKYTKIKSPYYVSPISSRDRYEAVNVTNRNTVEIRIFRGTLNRSIFFMCLESVDAMRKFTRNCKPEELHYKYFVEWVRKKRREYYFLFDYLVSKGYIPKPKRKRGRIINSFSENEFCPR